MSALVEQCHTQAIQDIMNNQEINTNKQSSMPIEKDPTVVVKLIVFYEIVNLNSSSTVSNYRNRTIASIISLLDEL